MTQEEKQLLLKDLCGRLPYGVMIKDTYYGHYGRLVEIGCKFAYFVSKLNSNTLDAQLCHVKPYLRPMSSMTEEEEDDLRVLKNCLVECNEDDDEKFYGIIGDIHNFYYSRHIDCNSLIDRGLALEAPDGMYK